MPHILSMGIFTYTFKDIRKKNPFLRKHAMSFENLQFPYINYIQDKDQKNIKHDHIKIHIIINVILTFHAH